MKNIDWNTVLTLLGLVVGHLGLSKWKERASAWEAKVVAKAQEFARDAATRVKRGVVGAIPAVREMEDRLERWVEDEAEKLPDPLRVKALAAAHEVFHKVHTYTDPAAAAFDKLDQAVVALDAKLVELRAKIAKLPKGTPKT